MVQKVLESQNGHCWIKAFYVQIHDSASESAVNIIFFFRMSVSTLQVLLYVPNLIGYARIVLLIISLFYMLNDPYTTAGLYLLRSVKKKLLLKMLFLKCPSWCIWRSCCPYAKSVYEIWCDVGPIDWSGSNIYAIDGPFRFISKICCLVCLFFM